MQGDQHQASSSRSAGHSTQRFAGSLEQLPSECCYRSQSVITASKHCCDGCDGWPGSTVSKLRKAVVLPNLACYGEDNLASAPVRF